MSQFPPGWEDARVLDHYDNQTEDEALAEDEAAFANPSTTLMPIPHELVPKVGRLLARHEQQRNAGA
jgi:hypothetical protein